MTRQQQRAASLLVAGIDPPVVARKLHIRQRLLEEWLRDGDFQRLCAERESLAERLVRYRVSRLHRRLVATIDRQLESPNEKIVQAAMTAGLRLCGQHGLGLARDALSRKEPDVAEPMKPATLSPATKQMLKDVLEKIRVIEDEERAGTKLKPRP